ncbi:MAG: hypothetical protein K9H26_10850 [Prolixibacteraceae bacterium]|nr:hypothetical protein [Prolixibacteraceae bacterium]
MTTITLTHNQLEKIRADLHGVKMLTNEEIFTVATRLNKVVNLPFLGEEKENIVLVKIVTWIDRALYQLLPNEYYELIHNAADGISPDEATLITERLTGLVNNVLNIPVLTERQERIAIRVVIGLIVNAMVKGFKL